MSLNKIQNHFSESIEVKKAFLESRELQLKIEKIVEVLVETFRSGNKLMLCGNGGSAADAQHIAAEFSGRYLYDREPLYAEALHVNSSYLTAVANDYSYNDVYARMVKAMSKKDDVLWVFSTSGESENIIKAVIDAQKLGVKTIAFTGESGGDLLNLVDICVNFPSTHTPHIQESHITAGHIVCQLVEEIIFPR
ncbi:MAG: D-sedoheptulose-7-phosphate isomerase [Bacteroidales bacterium]